MVKKERLWLINTVSIGMLCIQDSFGCWYTCQHTCQYACLKCVSLASEEGKNSSFLLLGPNHTKHDYNQCLTSASVVISVYTTPVQVARYNVIFSLCVRN